MNYEKERLAEEQRSQKKKENDRVRKKEWQKERE